MYISGWLEKSTAARDKFVPKTNLAVSSIVQGLGLVDFALLPHVDHKDHPESSTAKVERMSAEVPVPLYAIDDETAIRVVDDTVDVVSEGHWKLFTP